ncbi:MAG: hypothetical protein GY869_01440, partial [Planctomycetes bacterium]|nr:hypothetical protein [Planctomycetota bacterium]
APLAEAVKAWWEFILNHPDAVFTFGIPARYAHSGLGYLKRGAGTGQDGINIVEAFKEKPNKSTAHKYIRSGNYCWNSGMFVWRADTILQKLEDYLPHNAQRLRRIGAAWNTDIWNDVLQEEFGQLDSISIDFAVMERAKEVYMCELDCQWEDVGSYQTLADSIGTVDQEENVAAPSTKCIWLDSQNNIAISESPDHLIAAIHVEDLIIVHTPDATLICRRKETDRLRELLTDLKEKGFEQFL